MIMKKPILPGLGKKKKTGAAFCLSWLFLASCATAGYAGEQDNRTIVVLPFVNAGSFEYDILKDQIPTYFYGALKDLEGYGAVSHYKVRKFRDGYIDTIKNHNKESLEPIAAAFDARFIIWGTYSDSEGVLNATCFIIDTSTWGEDYKMPAGKIRAPIFYTLDEMFREIIRDFKGDILKTTMLSVAPDRECRLYVDGEYFGTAPMRMRLMKGEHIIELRHGGEDDAVSFYTRTIVLVPERDESLDVRVFAQLRVRAEKPCDVFIDGAKAGATPFGLNLYTGREYAVKCVYTADDGKKITAYDEVVSTVEYSTSASELPIDVSLAANSNLYVSGSRYDFFCSLSGGEPGPLPAAFENLEPGVYDVKIFAVDRELKRNVYFLDRTMRLYPFETVNIDTMSFSFEKQIGYCFLPCVPQFYNHEPDKGTLLLSFFAGSLLMSGISAIAAAGYYSEYDRVTTTLYNEGLASGLTQADVDRAYLPVASCNAMITAGLVLAGIVYVISVADGISGMDRVFDILNND